MLTVQYRMNEAIMNWSSREFYHGKLTADDSVKSHLLKDLSNIAKRSNDDEMDDENLSQCPLFLIDTTGYDMPEMCFDDENSRANEGEVALVQTHVNELIDNYGVSIDQIGVITPYNMQVQLLRQKLLGSYPTLEIKSVDGFQGREKEVIIMSMVRSNLHGDVGFLSDSRRINVAITRARRHLCIICNVQTVTHNPFIKRLIDYMLEHGQVRSAFELVDENSFFSSVNHPKKTPKSSNTKRTTQKAKQSKEQTIQRSEATNTLETVLTNILDQRMEAFLNDSRQQQLQFEDGLSPFGRRYVHQLAEKHDLQHSSEGLGDQRHIIVRKNSPQEVVKKESLVTTTNEKQLNKQFRSFVILEDNDELQLPVDKQTRPFRHSSDSDLFPAIEQTNKIEPSPIDPIDLCKFCRKEIPTQNRQLHEIYCQRVNPLSAMSIAVNETSNETSSKVNVASERPKLVKKKENKLAAMSAETPIDDLLDAARRQDNVCNAERCKMKITLLGQLCSSCNRRYCFEHSMPEVHGCGHQARKEIRQMHLATNSNTNPVYDNTPIRKEKRPYLERKLHDKITTKESQRKKK